jgi:hypothetical protein
VVYWSYPLAAHHPVSYTHLGRLLHVMDSTSSDARVIVRSAGHPAPPSSLCTDIRPEQHSITAGDMWALCNKGVEASSQTIPKTAAYYSAEPLHALQLVKGSSDSDCCCVPGPTSDNPKHHDIVVVKLKHNLPLFWVGCDAHSHL